MKLKMLLYCTKNKPYLIKNWFSGLPYLAFKELEQDVDYAPQLERIKLNGKIVAECDFEVEELELERLLHEPPYIVTYIYATKTIKSNILADRACLTYKEIDRYLGKLNYGKNGYAIHIKNLEIFDKPKELNAFYKSTNEFTFEPPLPLIKAPQNMCYAYDKYGNKYVVISVHPEWLCLILNGLKDVELRRKVLKEMKE